MGSENGWPDPSVPFAIAFDNRFFWGINTRVCGLCIQMFHPNVEEHMEAHPILAPMVEDGYQETPTEGQNQPPWPIATLKHLVCEQGESWPKKLKSEHIWFFNILCYSSLQWERVCVHAHICSSALQNRAPDLLELKWQGWGVQAEDATEEKWCVYLKHYTFSSRMNGAVLGLSSQAPAWLTKQLHKWTSVSLSFLYRILNTDICLLETGSWCVAWAALWFTARPLEYKDYRHGPPRPASCLNK